MATIKMVQGMTRELGRAQGYIPLPIRDEFIQSQDHPELCVHIMVTAWEFTPDEIDRFLAGASIEMRVVGATMPIEMAPRYDLDGHPAFMLTVGLVPIDEDTGV